MPTDPTVIAALALEEDRAARALDTAKAACREACDDVMDEVRALDPDARARAIVAHTVRLHGSDAIGRVIGGATRIGVGPKEAESGAYLDPEHVAEVGRVALGTAQGGDPVQLAGADPAHVDVLERAHQAHQAHAQALEAAYLAFSKASHAKVAAELAP